MPQILERSPQAVQVLLDHRSVEDCNLPAHQAPAQTADCAELALLRFQYQDVFELQIHFDSQVCGFDDISYA